MSYIATKNENVPEVFVTRDAITGGTELMIGQAWAWHPAHAPVFEVQRSGQPDDVLGEIRVPYGVTQQQLADLFADFVDENKLDES